ncbi:MAG: doxx family protein [Arenibacter troitsensis]|nr:doxx family protein [Arenibacter troitsensis]
MMRLTQNGRMLCISIGIIYLWFGFLKFFPGLSPADTLAKQTISLLTFNFIPERMGILLLAIIEVAIGICLIFKIQLKKVIVAAIAHLVLTFVPVVFFPEISFSQAPFSLTLVGQYIIKNIVIISALLLIYPRSYENLTQ